MRGHSSRHFTLQGLFVKYVYKTFANITTLCRMTNYKIMNKLFVYHIIVCTKLNEQSSYLIWSEILKLYGCTLGTKQFYFINITCVARGQYNFKIYLNDSLYLYNRDQLHCVLGCTICFMFFSSSHLFLPQVPDVVFCQSLYGRPSCEKIH